MNDPHAYLERLQPLAMRFGLERMERALDALGHPERSFPILQVGGTNGKGSTCAMAAAALRAAGHRVGLYTSPHLVAFNERIQVDGQPIADAALAARVEAIRRAWSTMETEAGRKVTVALRSSALGEDPTPLSFAKSTILASTCCAGSRKAGGGRRRS